MVSFEDKTYLEFLSRREDVKNTLPELGDSFIDVDNEIIMRMENSVLQDFIYSEEQMNRYVTISANRRRNYNFDMVDAVGVLEELKPYTRKNSEYFGIDSTKPEEIREFLAKTTIPCILNWLVAS